MANFPDERARGKLTMRKPSVKQNNNKAKQLLFLLVLFIFPFEFEHKKILPQNKLQS
jgi:hypothetical protein